MRFLERFWFGCGHCHDGSGCSLAEHTDPKTGELRLPVRGAALVGTVIVVFLLPLAATIGGAYAADRWYAGASDAARGTAQAGGAIAGFFAGVVFARLILWIGRPITPADGGGE